MRVPLAVAGPALLAGAAYLDARFQLGYDLGILARSVPAVKAIALQARRDRINLFYVLESHALSKGGANRPLLIYQGQEWTYSEVYDIVLKCGTWLKMRFGVAQGEVVAMDLMNGPWFLFFWLALWSLGAIPAFINYNLTGAPLLHSIKASGSRLLLVEEEVRPRFTAKVIDTLNSPAARDGKGPVETVFLTPELEAEIMATRGARESDASRGGVTLRDNAILIFTSGTTGYPKPAVISWRKCLGSAWVTRSHLGFKKSERFYTCMPLYHASAVCLAFGPMLANGSTIVLGRNFSPQTFWKEVRESKATVIQYVGETCRYLLTAPPQIDPSTKENLDKKHHVRMAFGNGLRRDVWERFKTRFGIETIVEFYSATEAPQATSNISVNSFASGAMGRNGLLTSILQAKATAIVEVDWSTESPFRDPNNDNLCKPVKRGEAGELLYLIDANDPSMKFSGYYGNREATERKIMRDVLKKGDAYFHTGDVVRWDNEGRWWFVDRIGDTFRWKSENVSTAEVGDALGMHPRVLEANVYGVEIPHYDGRAGCAALLLDNTSTGASVPTTDSAGPDGRRLLMDDIARHVQGRLPRYAVPLFLRVVKEEMERTGTNKQVKVVLREKGVDPAKSSEGETLYWLKGGTYVPFTEKEWAELKGGRVKL
ncbi:MAG: hypothetical protein Q9163_003019 [Psora crenata]